MRSRLIDGDRRFCSSSGLEAFRSSLNKRGWTNSLIRDLLIEESAIAPNPYFNGKIMILFSLSRVHQLEIYSRWLLGHRFAKSETQHLYDKRGNFLETEPL